MRTLPTVVPLAVLMLAGAGTAAPSGPGEAARETLPARDEVRTPEGFIRAEGPDPDPGRASGSFGTYHPAPAGVAVRPTSEIADRYAAEGAEVGAGRRPVPDPCRAERDRYVRRLLLMAGIDLEHPSSLLRPLAGPGGYTGEYLFTAYGLLAGVEPLRPLAWDSELRLAAAELAECGERAPPAR